MITRIEATWYRCLERVAVDVPQYGVLVGANGAGKTTFLDIPGLIHDMLEQRDITQAFTHRQNNHAPRCSQLDELIYCGRGKEFILALEATLPENVVQELIEDQADSIKQDPSKWNKFVRYELRIEIFNDRQLQVKNEYLFLFSETTPPSRDGSPLLGESPPRKMALYYFPSLRQ